MKRIVYSTLFKALAVILFCVSTVAGVLTVAGGLKSYFNEEPDIYSFEQDFAQSWYLAQILSEPEYAVYDAVYSVIRKEGTQGDLSEGNFDLDEHREAIAENIKKGLAELSFADELYYFVQWDDTRITNSFAVTPEELMQGEHYFYVKRDSSGRVERTSSVAVRSMLLEVLANYDSESTLIISCRLTEEAVGRYRAVWDKQEGIVVDTFKKTLAYALIALLLLIYLIAVCGKGANGAALTVWYDRIPAEAHLAVTVGSGVGAVVLCALVLDEHLSGHFPPDLVTLTIGSVTAFGSLLLLASLLSTVRNLKTRKLAETSILFCLIKWIVRFVATLVKWIGRKVKAFWVILLGIFAKKTGVILITMLFIYTVLIGILGIATVVSPLWLILGVLLFGFACFVAAYRAKDLDEIKKGVSEIRLGNVGYIIPEVRCEDMKKLAENVNGIAKGLDEAVAARVKAERLKSELITNVSHDLKTPITSIINYSELLLKTEGLPGEAEDYARIIAKKSDRLKKLTEDLFAISKVQSGNGDVVLETLDAALLIHQALGEHDSEIQSAGLVFMVEASKDLYISADGRKMARVFSNLIHNILKYTMKNTRVFIHAFENDGTVEIVFKNVSAYPLNFSADEITQRFVRGDESRTEEGNGLGLAIAKSYTEICGGHFEIVVDGDLFKAILSFKTVKQQ